MKAHFYLTCKSSGRKHIYSLDSEAFKPQFAMFLSPAICWMSSLSRTAPLVPKEFAIWFMVLSNPSSTIALDDSSVLLNVRLFAHLFDPWSLLFSIKSFNDSQDTIFCSSLVYLLFVPKISWVFLLPVFKVWLFKTSCDSLSFLQINSIFTYHSNHLYV